MLDIGKVLALCDRSSQKVKWCAVCLAMPKHLPEDELEPDDLRLQDVASRRASLQQRPLQHYTYYRYLQGSVRPTTQAGKQTFYLLKDLTTVCQHVGFLYKLYTLYGFWCFGGYTS